MARIVEFRVDNLIVINRHTRSRFLIDHALCLQNEASQILIDLHRRRNFDVPWCATVDSQKRIQTSEEGI